MITLRQFPPAGGLPVSVSPFCAKLELYLRLTERPFKTAPANPQRSPNKMVPYIERDGELVADSAEIIARLEAEGPALDEDLTDAQRQRAEAWRARVEDRLYFAILYSRFVDPEGWSSQVHAVRAMVPWLLRLPAVPLIRRSQVKRLEERGFVEPNVVYAEAVDHVRALGEALAEGPFLLGAEPHVVDCALWGQLVQGASTPGSNPVTAAIRSDARLMGFLQRLAGRAGLTLPAASFPSGR